jgi:hypothetical protein
LPPRILIEIPGENLALVVGREFLTIGTEREGGWAKAILIFYGGIQFRAKSTVQLAIEYPNY